VFLTSRCRPRRSQHPRGTRDIAAEPSHQEGEGIDGVAGLFLFCAFLGCLFIYLFVVPGISVRFVHLPLPLPSFSFPSLRHHSLEIHAARPTPIFPPAALGVVRWG
jgi:hypothetical protein